MWAYPVKGEENDIYIPANDRPVSGTYGNQLTVPGYDDTPMSLSDQNPEDDYDDEEEDDDRIRVKSALEEISDFIEGSSVHGVRYFAEKGRHWTERVFWAICLSISLFLCVNLIENIYIKWRTSPVIVTFSEKATPIWKIPFPAVTICPETKTYTSKLNFTIVYKMIKANRTDEIPAEQIERIKAVYQLCDSNFVEPLGQNFTDDSFLATVRDVGLRLNDTMSLCKWHSNINECENIYKPNIAEDGLCYTFNVLNSKQIYRDIIAADLLTQKDNPTATNWNMEDGYFDVDINDNSTYPYRVFGSGSRIGLFNLLRLADKDRDFECRGPIQGFKVLLHNPGEPAQLSQHYFRVPLSQEVMISVKPQVIITADNLLDYTPERRQCFFNRERSLKFFIMYSQRNCEIECLANHTKSECGCVKFSMPRENDTLVCGSDKIHCYNRAEETLIRKTSKKNKNKRNYNDKKPKACNCLPSCVSVQYDAEISQAKFDKDNALHAQKYEGSTDEFIDAQPARLSVFFKDHQYVALKRSELYGHTDFIANCGGLLGLFLGVSVLSVIEGVYYFTLRLGCTYRIEKQQELEDSVTAVEKNYPDILIATPAGEIIKY